MKTNAANRPATSREAGVEWHLQLSRGLPNQDGTTTVAFWPSYFSSLASAPWGGS